jgi:hypothetical protein
MPEPTTVWAVDLIRDPRSDRGGTLSLQPGALVFQAHAESSEALRIPLDSVKKVRRLRGSPVLLVVHDRNGLEAQTALYFVQPPPLDPVAGRAERPSPLPFGRTSRRRVRRQNVGYLGLSNREKRGQVQEWARAVVEAVAGERGASGRA